MLAAESRCSFCSVKRLLEVNTALYWPLLIASCKLAMPSGVKLLQEGPQRQPIGGIACWSALADAASCSDDQ